MATREQRPSAVPASEPILCPRCGTEAEPGQEYCLVCGLRLRAGGAAGTRWILPRDREPAEWLLVVLVALIVAAAGAALAIVFSRPAGHRPVVVATSPVTSQPTPTVTVNTTSPLPTAPTATQPTTTTAAKPHPKALVAWPSGKNGYTVVLNSLPRTSAGRASALAQARQAVSRGLRDVGILDSSRYSSLHPGYWVVFSGIYSAKTDADAAVPRAKSVGYPPAYERQITT